MVNKVLFLSTINPIQCDNGKAVVIYGMCDFLYKKLGDDRFLFACLDELDTQLPWPSVPVKRSSFFKKILTILKDVFFLRKKSIQEAFFHSEKILKEIQLQVDQFKPDIIIFDTVRLGQYLGELKGNFFSIIYLDDLFSLRYEKMILVIKENKEVELNPLGNFIRHFPFWLQKILLKMDFMHKYLLEFEKKLIAASEISLSNKADLSLLISSEEVAVLKDKVSANTPIDVIPPSLTKITSFERTWCGEPEFIFIGSMNIAHNSVAIVSFVEQVLPILIIKNPNLNLKIIGKNAPPKLLLAKEKYPNNIKIMGFVEDINQELAGCCAMIAPLLFGSGVKLKVIDALANGVPVISTKFGVEGIEFVHGRHGYVCENINDFPVYVNKLLSKEQNLLFSKNNKELFNKNYSKKAIDKIYARLFLESHIPVKK